MRESIGGAWLFGIVIVFIFLFAAFLTYSINYTRAFNIKNEVLNYIEQNEGFNTINDGSEAELLSYNELMNTTQGKIYYLVNSVGYNIDITSQISCGNNEVNYYGVCVAKVCPYGTSSPQTNTHYKVTSYIALEIPIIGVSINIPITGETRTIYTDNGSMPCTTDNEMGG